jgi:tetraprenyl-beta-curcumene synthase
MATQVGDRLALTATFTHAALSYWLDVFPQVCREISGWHHKAGGIPDSALREVALAVHSTKRGNLEGAAAFAAFSPAASRRAVIRAQIAFQTIYDYVDTLAEQPARDPIQNGRQLHQALVISLGTLSSPHPDYYLDHAKNADGGYLKEVIDACRNALHTLPSYSVVADSARRLAERIVNYQSFNLTLAQGSETTLERWATAEIPPQSDLRWWEIAASAGSSLGIFALIAMASNTDVSPADALAVENAYFPWIGSLHSLLDSLVDLAEDVSTGQQNLVAHYESIEEMATRMQMITVESIRLSEGLPNGTQHSLVLTAMVCFYLSAEEARLPYACQSRAKILEVLGGLSKSTMLVLDLRRLVGRIG